MEKSILSNFTNKRIAKECIDKLLEIDRMGSNRLDDVYTMLFAFLEGMRPLEKNQKNEFLKLIK